MSTSGLVWINPATTPPALAAATPQGRSEPAMATDPVTGNVVLFGGRGVTTPTSGCCQALGDTWLWNGQFWREVDPPLSPEPRGNAAMAADPATGTIVLFGGQTNTDTWTWDGRSETWTPQVPPLSPGPRSSASMATDPSTNTVVMFGGFTAFGEGRDDTWVWDGTAKTWTPKFPAASPPGRLSAAMATDASTGTVVLFGGERNHPAGDILGDTWVWNGRNETWTEQTPSTKPGPRLYAYMASHPPTNRVVLFGGVDNQVRRNDTWTWNGTKRIWTKQVPTNRPCPRNQGRMAYHPSSGTAVIFGGFARSPCPDTPLPLVEDTWAWNGVNWKRKA